METKYIDLGERRIAYRSIGAGIPMIFCNRFRGVMDTWDPLFIEAMSKSYNIILFDYSGIGESSGVLPGDVYEVARDIDVIAKFLRFDEILLLGWSYGGTVAQAATFLFPELVTKTVLIGTNPPGENDHDYEEAFLNAALKPLNDFDDEVALFFEPASHKSVASAKSSHARIHKHLVVERVPSELEVFQRYFAGVAVFKEDRLGLRDAIQTTDKPILVLSGDHDVSCPVENWYALSGRMNAVQIIVLPKSGHGPHHQHASLVASYIKIL